MKKKGGILLFLLVILVVAGTTIIFAANDEVSEEERTANIAYISDDAIIPEGIFVNDMDLSNQTVKEAGESVSEYLQQFSKQTVVLKIGEEQVEIPFSELGFEADSETIMNEIKKAMPQGNIIRRYMEQKDLESNPKKLDLSISFNEDVVKTKLNESLEPFKTEAKEPTVKRENGKFIVEEGKIGYTFDENAIYQQVREAIASAGTSSEPIVCEVEHTESRPTLDPDIFSHFSEKALGTCTTEFDASIAGRTQNIQLAADKINGRVYMPGETISTLDMLAPVTKEGRYQDAGTIENGQIVDSVGGGICQVASTLYNAVLWSELDVTYRRGHSMYIFYVEPAMDAMVYAAGNSDFTFVNNTDYPIYLEAYRSGGKITISIYGTEQRPANRTIKYVPEVIENVYNQPYYNMAVDNSLPLGKKTNVGEKIRVAYTPHPKMTARLWKEEYVDGVLTNRTEVNTTKYKAGTGMLYHSADCTFDVWIDSQGRFQFDIKYKNGSTTSAKPQESTTKPEESSNELESTTKPEESSNDVESTTKPVETTPAETQPTTPAQTTPAQTQPTTPVQTTPAQTQPTTPAQTQPTTPVQTQPTTPVQTTPAQTQPTTPVQAQSDGE